MNANDRRALGQKCWLTVPTEPLASALNPDINMHTIPACEDVKVVEQNGLCPVVIQHMGHRHCIPATTQLELVSNL